MTDATTLFFDELDRLGHLPALGKLEATMRFDLAHEGKTDRWLVAIDKGDVAVSRRNARADCVLRADRSLFERLAGGQANAMAALLRGDIRVEGDPQLLVLFQRLLPGPGAPRKHGPSRASESIGQA